jgi:hypothetical protein
MLGAGGVLLQTELVITAVSFRQFGTTFAKGTGIEGNVQM